MVVPQPVPLKTTDDEGSSWSVDSDLNEVQRAEYKAQNRGPNAASDNDTLNALPFCVSDGITLTEATTLAEGMSSTASTLPPLFEWV